MQCTGRQPPSARSGRTYDSASGVRCSNALDFGFSNHGIPSIEVACHDLLEIARAPGRWLTPQRADALTTAGSVTCALISALSRATISCGNLAGPTTPAHDITENPGKPASAMVGTSGRSAKRVLPVTAIARSLPALMFSRSVMGGSMNKSIRLASSSVMAGAPPRKGMVWISILARCAK